MNRTHDANCEEPLRCGAPYGNEIARRHRGAPNRIFEPKYNGARSRTFFQALPRTTRRMLVGVDIQIAWNGTPLELSAVMSPMATRRLRLHLVDRAPDGGWSGLGSFSRGARVWRCRFLSVTAVGQEEIACLVSVLAAAGFEIVKTESLYLPDGQDFSYMGVLGCTG